MERSVEMKNYRVRWRGTNGRGIPQLPKFYTFLDIQSEDPETAAEIACVKLGEIITEQFPRLQCRVLPDTLEPYGLIIEIFDEGKFIGKIYGLEVEE